ncbi:MAG TPA: hypothetical protein VH143_15070 [Kofleriaceae bacterium]|nr:hypothetical protein [Kofleriaceae bacterium]
MRYIALAALLACHVAAPRPPSPPVTDVVLFRDAAVITQRLDVELGTSTQAIDLELPAGATDIAAVDIAGIAVAQLRVPIGSDGGDDADAGSALATSPRPMHAHLDVAAPHAGRYALAVSYVTDKLTWTASYTIATNHARDRATLFGALAVTNASGLALPFSRVTLVDAPVAGWRARQRENLAASLVGEAAATTPFAKPRLLGDVALPLGDTRVELPGISAPRAMKSVLVYDPIGTSHDSPGSMPVRDANLGVVPSAPTQVSESFEIARDPIVTDGLPAGAAKLYERAGDGSLALLGEARLFDEATRVAAVDTIPVGTALGVTGHRERRDLEVQDDELGHRLTEEFVITVDNARERPVEVLVREHLYRGETWLIAYESTNRPAKEGAQQIALRTEVPAKAKTEVTYVVVYSWKP